MEIKDDKIIPLSEYISPNLFQLIKKNKIYFIDILKNNKNIPKR